MRDCFVERCDVCHESTRHYKTFMDKNNHAHIICDECVSSIKCLWTRTNYWYII